jgi:hypothetical protein
MSGKQLNFAKAKRAAAAQSGPARWQKPTSLELLRAHVTRARELAKTRARSAA